MTTSHRVDKFAGMGGLPAFRTDPRVKCGETTREMFFYADGERQRNRTTRDQIAKGICRACPLRVECGAHALKHEEEWGMWGGLSEAERRWWWRRYGNNAAAEFERLNSATGAAA